ncbi:innexin inx2-like [Sitodiplosis mosellana]|uniref:innexin inx2-like n=1 Tax=Sitodiplosis mosellana TaxID=263140 RepID=UPI0024451349|nr:innexin inx2-like [Sitodiplosis mosellana]
MLEIYKSVKELLKLDRVCIDNTIFRLHYKATVIILITCSLFATSNQYIGNPIDCITENVPSHAMNSYCWIYGTYTVPERLNGVIGRDIIQPGVGSRDGASEIKFHKYYQWVCFVLFFQAILFYMPRFLWKSWEENRIKMLVHNLNSLVVPEDNKEERKKIIINYFKLNMGHHNGYMAKFFFCEVLNFINIISQLYFMDYFLDGEFSTYGFEVLKFTSLEPEIRVDPMARVFPKVAKCTFSSYGPSGSLQNFDSLYILPLNIINEKIYVFLWYWFIILTILTTISLVLEAFILSCSLVRKMMLKSRLRCTRLHNVVKLLAECKVGDWFILYLLSLNIDAVVFEEIIADMSASIESAV